MKTLATFTLLATLLFSGCGSTPSTQNIGFNDEVITCDNTITKFQAFNDNAEYTINIGSALIVVDSEGNEVFIGSYEKKECGISSLFGSIETFTNGEALINDEVFYISEYN